MEQIKEEVMRTTVTFNDKVYKALKVWAAETGESLSSLVDDAVKYQILEDLEDLKIAKERENEPTMDFEEFVAEMKADGLI